MESLLLSGLLVRADSHFDCIVRYIVGNLHQAGISAVNHSLIARAFLRTLDFYRIRLTFDYTRGFIRVYEGGAIKHDNSKIGADKCS